MKILVAGATGAIGKRLVPLLVTGGHHVVATTQTADKLRGLRAAGAEAVLMNGLDRDNVMAVVGSSRPDVVVHQMTALAPMLNPKKFDDELAVTNRLRREGTSHLAAAAIAAGTGRLIAQSYTGWPNQREGGRVKTEADPLDAHPPALMTRTLDAIQALERLVVKTDGLDGIALRYGSLYGPGTALSSEGEIVALVRQRKFPLVGDGAGVWSFVHIEDAAEATVAAIERGRRGIYNIVDDEPAAVADWLPAAAEAFGAKRPWHVPRVLGRLLAGEAATVMMTEVRGASNAKAKRELDWQPRHPSWREGFEELAAA